MKWGWVGLMNEEKKVMAAGPQQTNPTTQSIHKQEEKRDKLMRLLVFSLIKQLNQGNGNEAMKGIELRNGLFPRRWPPAHNPPQTTKHTARQLN